MRPVAIITEALHKIDELSARLKIAEKGDTEPIAVVGMGCRLPGGVNNPTSTGSCCRTARAASFGCREPLGRRRVLLGGPHCPGTICTREGGFLTSWEPDEFDAEFFGICPREAAGMDPQQRLLLEVAWEALEDAGIAAHAIRGTQTSVFVGLTTNDYSLTFAGQSAARGPRRLRPVRQRGQFRRGPVVVFPRGARPGGGHRHGVLVVVGVGAPGLSEPAPPRERHRPAAGVNLMLSPENSIACSRFGMLSPDGQCKTFDADADGYVRSEGCGVVVLKRLSDALARRGSGVGGGAWVGVNQDGASSGQTVPNGPAQQALIRQVLAASRLTPADIDYIEAHGTGTALG